MRDETQCDTTSIAEAMDVNMEVNFQLRRVPRHYILRLSTNIARLKPFCEECRGKNVGTLREPYKHDKHTSRLK